VALGWRNLEQKKQNKTGAAGRMLSYPACGPEPREVQIRDQSTIAGNLKGYT